MKIEILDSFADKLDRQVEFIAQDKPNAARKFRKDVIAKTKGSNRILINAENRYSLRIET